MALETEINAFQARREELEAHHMGKFVVFHGHDFIGAFGTLDNAAAAATRLFGSGPYLIQQVGGSPSTAPIRLTTRSIGDYVVHANWDADSRTWWTDGEDIPGLTVQADTFEALVEVVLELAPDLLHENAAVPSGLSVNITIIAERQTTCTAA
jgi:hypothetical protein